MSRTTHGGQAPSRADPSQTSRPARWDARGYYRRILALVAPVPLAAMGIIYLIDDLAGEVSFADLVAAVETDSGVRIASQWLALAFFALLIPAVLAVAAVTWRRVPRLTAVAVTLTVPGFAAAFGVLPDDHRVAELTHELGLDVDAVGPITASWWEEPIALLAGLAFIVGIVVGLGMLGVALWRSRLAPAWMGIALALGGATHPFLPGHVAQGIGLLVAAVGFSGATVALLRMSNDDFALAPQEITSTEGAPAGS